MENSFTYMMFTKKDNAPNHIVGPFFYSQRNVVKHTNFAPNEQTYLIEETAFASFFPNEYYDHLCVSWFDKVYCYIKVNSYWIGRTEASWHEKCFRGDWFGIFEMADEEGGTYVQLRTSIDANPFHVARLINDLYEQCSAPFEISKQYYQDQKGKIFTERAVSKFLSKQLINNMCLS